MEKPESLQLPLQSDTKDFSFDHLKEINDAMLDYPKDFHVLKKLNKVLEKRREPFEKEGGSSIGLKQSNLLLQPYYKMELQFV